MADKSKKKNKSPVTSAKSPAKSPAKLPAKPISTVPTIVKLPVKVTKSPAIPVMVTPANNPIATVIHNYILYGWNAMKPPSGSINDVVAQKDKRFHFIQVITVGDENNPKFEGLSRSQFIQNAFANGAIPVYAYIVLTKAGSIKGGGGGGDGQYKVKLTDINTNTRIIIARHESVKGTVNK